MRDARNPQFTRGSVLAQNLVDKRHALREGQDHEVLSGSVPSGPECFSRYIRAAEIPHNFRLATRIIKLTGESKPEIWLEDYPVAVQIGGGNDNVAMKHLLLVLEGYTWARWTQLALGSIFFWDDLARVFVRNFEGTCKRPGGLAELQNCVKEKNETLREYIRWWTTLKNTVENITEHQEIYAFKAGVRYRELNMKFRRTETLVLSRAMEIASRYANVE